MNKETIQTIADLEQVESIEELNHNRLLITLKKEEEKSKEEPYIAIKCDYKEQYNFLLHLAKNIIIEDVEPNECDCVVFRNGKVVFVGSIDKYEDDRFIVVKFSDFIKNKYEDEYAGYLINLAEGKNLIGKVIQEPDNYEIEELEDGVYYYEDGNIYLENKTEGCYSIFKDGDWAEILEPLQSTDLKDGVYVVINNKIYQ